MVGRQKVDLEITKTEIWLASSRKQMAGYKTPAEREAHDYTRYDYYLQTAASEASFALEHLLRAIHFLFHKHPEPNFAHTEALIGDANRFLEKARLDPIHIHALQVLRAAIANEESLRADRKVDWHDLEIYILSIESAVARVKRLRESILKF